MRWLQLMELLSSAPASVPATERDSHGPAFSTPVPGTHTA
jgi:hypothetical protein